MKSQGLTDDMFDGRPVIGISNTWSELTPCNVGLRNIAEHVKRGVWEAGGLPLEFPSMSLGETQMRPTAMLYRNLLAMETEELIRANPIDGVVLLGGCDKTTPGQVMGAASVNLPTIVVSTGPMLNGRYRGQPIGSGTDVWRFSEMVRAGDMPMDDFIAVESGMSRSAGTCNTMGSASTFACIVEAMGLALPFNGSAPAVDAERQKIAHLAGRTIVARVHDNTCFADIATRPAFDNAIRVHAALGGSTNAVIHLLALAGRLGVPLGLDDFDTLTKEVPLLLNLQPSGQYLMEDFHYAGGLPALLAAIDSLLDRDALTVTGQPLSSYYQHAECHAPAVIGSLDKPIKPVAGTWVLRGNLCPDGAILKPSAASPQLLQHRGRAIVFTDIEDFRARIDDPELEVDENSVLVLLGCGPRGYPGMPEVGNMPLPRKLLERGITDLLRISDARMSGTAYGTVVLHVAPESAAGGPLGLVRTGDTIAFDAHQRSLQLLVDDGVLEQRRQQHEARAEAPHSTLRGYQQLYRERVMQANLGCDFDFLQGASGAEFGRESH